MKQIDTHHARVHFGPHRGTRVTRLPRGYLAIVHRKRSRQMIRLHDGRSVALWRVAEAEMNRRQIRIPGVDITGHAIDRFTQSYLDIWRRYRKGDQGVHSFLAGQVKAMASRPGIRKLSDNGMIRIKKFGIVFVLDIKYQIPALVTVM